MDAAFTVLGKNPKTGSYAIDMMLSFFDPKKSSLVLKETQGKIYQNQLMQTQTFGDAPFDGIE